MKKILLFIAIISISSNVWGQEYVFQTFKDRWIINTQSVDMLPKNTLDFRVTHRFGDFLGANGGFSTFYGLDNSEDVLIGFEYGATDDLTVGISRTKGAGSLRQLINTSAKYRLIQQATDKSPISLTAVGVGSISAMSKVEDSEGLNGFPKFTHRIVYNLQLLAARKFSDAFSVQVSGGWTHRNLVPSGEENDLFNVGLATRIQISRVTSLIGDFTIPLNGIQSEFGEIEGGITYSPIIGLGVEFETGGHVFQVNFVNAQGIVPTDYIPYTRNGRWRDGEFRLGFTISRMFNAR